jgi:hypothetical protein
VAKCYPIYYSTIENWKIFAKQNDINVNIFYNYFLQEILILSLIENTLKLFDTRVEDSLTFNYENFAKMLGVKINKVKDYFDETINIGKFFPEETLWGNSENEDIIGLIVQNSIFCIFVTCQLKNTGNINISYYFILIKGQNIVFIPINEIKFYTYKVLYQDLTNGEKIITKLQPLTPIPELDCEIMPIEGENVNSLLITEIEKLGDMIDEVSNLKVTDFLVERQGIELFIYDKNKNITSKYILKKEEYQEIPELMELTDEDIPEIYLINGISVFWPRVHYKLSLSEFTLVNK